MITDKALEAMDVTTLVIFLDLSKGFDSVDHRRRLAKLKHWGLVVLHWNGLDAICRDVNNPLGSVLRPQVWVLFLMVYHRVPS